MSQPIGVFIITFNSQGQILLGKRVNSYKSGFYGMPGGRVEVGEKLKDCAKRELKEETDLHATELRYLGVVKENQGEYDFIHFVFTANIGDQKPVCLEADKCEKWEWFKIDDLPEKILPGHLAGMEMYKSSKNIIEI